MDHFRRFLKFSRDAQVRVLLSARNSEDALTKLASAQASDDALDSRLANANVSDIRAALSSSSDADEFESALINKLQGGALYALDRAGIHLAPTRMAMLESLEFNACARIISGVPSITVNFALVLYLLHWWHGLRSILSIGAKTPFCVCHSSAEHAISLFRIAQAARSGSLKPLGYDGILECSCRKPWDVTVSDHATDTELFVILHEMGHVHLGHLECDRSTIDAAYSMEYEADSFAINVLVGAGMDADRALLGAGGFLTLAEIVEGLSPAADNTSHPHPRDRWDRLLSELSSTSKMSEVHRQAQLMSTVTNEISKFFAARYESEYAGSIPASICDNVLWTRQSRSHYTRGVPAYRA